MKPTDRQRIDYMPGDAAREALAIAQRLYPDNNAQALLDRLVITGLVALQWKPPSLYGRDRERWQLPESLKQIPGDDG
jgi:hypothetical protein